MYQLFYTCKLLLCQSRLFDSQNNDRGGYNVGSMGSLYYYEGSILSIEWTNQHSCGDQNNHCEQILQYMCGDQVRDGATTRWVGNWRYRIKPIYSKVDKSTAIH